MPTSQYEAIKIKQIIDEYLTKDDAAAITARLCDEVGKNTDNDSLKVSLFMLKKLYEGEQSE
jgi:hypothetical protein|tara:strand:- start:561 stop:746 length:186 start_codon:yes stop_codon:yes gene_type:complete